jgi:P-type conjugative transfer protein TrbJ
MRELRSDLFMVIGVVLVTCTIFLCMECTAPKEAQAQLVVSDPTNLFQNASSAVSEAQAVLNQLVQLERQLQEIDYAYKNLKSLDKRQFADLQTSFYTLQSLYYQGRGISLRWGQTASQWEQMYTRWRPSSGKTYAQQHQEWDNQTRGAIQSAATANSVVSATPAREAEIARLGEVSMNAQGPTQAIQAATAICAILSKQLQELIQLIALDSQARLSHMSEEKAKSDASSAAVKDKLRDYPTEEESRRKRNPQKNMPSFKGSK